MVATKRWRRVWPPFLSFRRCSRPIASRWSSACWLGRSRARSSARSAMERNERMADLRVVSGGRPTVRVYLRRSKADEGHQQFSLDVQRDGCRRFVVEELARRDLMVSWDERVEYVDDDRAGDDFLGRTELRRL